MHETWIKVVTRALRHVLRKPTVLVYCLSAVKLLQFRRDLKTVDDGAW